MIDPAFDDLIPAPQTAALQGGTVDFDDLIPAPQVDAPQEGAIDFSDLIPNRAGPWQSSSSAVGGLPFDQVIGEAIAASGVDDGQSVPVQGDLRPISQRDLADLDSNWALGRAQDQGRASLNGSAGPASPASALPDASNEMRAPLDFGLDGTAMNPGAPPGMMFARYFVQPDETAFGSAVGNSVPVASGASERVHPLAPIGAIVLQTQLDTSPGARTAMPHPVYRYDHAFDSMTDIHPDLSKSSVDAPGGSMHVWNSNGDNIAVVDSLGYDA